MECLRKRDQVSPFSTQSTQIIEYGRKRRDNCQFLQYRSGRTSILVWTTMYKWDHPVATLPSDEGPNAS
eukprot:6175326-Pleurochrysis_carterae.AAC.1